MQKEDYHNLNNTELFNSFNNLTKQLKQAESILSSLRCGDNYQHINDEDLGNSLWATSDLVDNAIQSADGVWKSINTINNQGAK